MHRTPIWQVKLAFRDTGQLDIKLLFCSFHGLSITCKFASICGKYARRAVLLGRFYIHSPPFARNKPMVRSYWASSPRFARNKPVVRSYWVGSPRFARNKPAVRSYWASSPRFTRNKPAVRSYSASSPQFTGNKHFWPSLHGFGPLKHNLFA